ncbi:FAD/NAD-binding domain-containing protein [Phellopilus nigrolimitatus]|nr:FAD/NAD-binding domain-containing protein [Phellopilus nigrolimitatus]
MPFPATPVHENLFHRRAAVSLDIIVVGGSISGLSAAYNLRQAGHNVRVVERSNRELKTDRALRIPPNMSKLLQHWGLGTQLRQKATRCPRVDFLEGETGNHQSSLVNHDALMKELQADMYAMHYTDLYNMIRELATRSGVQIDYNVSVVDVDVSATLDGRFSLTRERLVGRKEKHSIGPYTTYSFMVSAKAMREDPQLSSLVEDGAWSVWTGSSRCALCYLVQPDEYLVQIVQSDEDAPPSHEEIEPLSKLDMSEFEDRVQRLLALGTCAIETQHVILDPIENWHSDDGKIVLVGDSIHAAVPPSLHGAALAMEDGAVLGSLFSRLQSRGPEEILRLLKAYQEVRQERAQTTIASEADYVAFSVLDVGPSREARDEGFRVLRAQQSLDWKSTEEEVLRGRWEEYRGSFGYEAYDAADDWWVDWGVLQERMTAARSKTPVGRPDRTPIDGLKTHTVTTLSDRTLP